MDAKRRGSRGACPLFPRNHRNVVAWFLATGFLAAAPAGCSSVPLKRFQNADRIDVTVNPGWFEFDEPFASQFARLKAMHQPSCSDAETVQAVYRIIEKYPDKWVEYWAIPPESPPVTLTFHAGTQWLGTLDVYEAALGHVGDRIRRIEKKDADRIIELVGDCAADAAAGDSR